MRPFQSIALLLQIFKTITSKEWHFWKEIQQISKSGRALVILRTIYSIIFFHHQKYGPQKSLSFHLVRPRTDMKTVKMMENWNFFDIKWFFTLKEATFTKMIFFHHQKYGPQKSLSFHLVRTWKWWKWWKLQIFLMPSWFLP